MKWITREKPKIDRLACPWLIKRFIDKEAEFFYVPKDQVISEAKNKNAVPYDVPNVELTHDGELCSFDAFIKKYQLKDKGLEKLAEIVRAADTDTLEKSQESYGLLAITLGLSQNISNDHELLKVATILYDGLYRWCKDLTGEKHGWYPEKM